MSDIFLSYDRRDFDRVKVLVEILESQGWSVFFDRTTLPGRAWRQLRSKELDACRCMIVAWTSHSVNANGVEVEAYNGLKRKILVPILLDQVTPPLEFGYIQTVNLVGWMGETDSSDYLALCKALTERIGPG